MCGLLEGEVFRLMTLSCGRDFPVCALSRLPRQEFACHVICIWLYHSLDDLDSDTLSFHSLSNLYRFYLYRSDQVGIIRKTDVILGEALLDP